MRREFGSPTRERGSASIWVVACCSLTAMLAVVGVLRASAVLVRHHVESAADLAALAAAGQIGAGGDPCTSAAAIAAANRVRLVSCVFALSADARSGAVAVAVEQTVRFALIGPRSVRATARAGRVAG